MEWRKSRAASSISHRTNKQDSTEFTLEMQNKTRQARITRQENDKNSNNDVKKQ